MEPNKVIVAPSLLAADFSNLDKEMTRLKEAGVKYLHFDVMDGVFVPNISFGPLVLKALKKYGFIMDVHLMITKPERYIDEFIEAGADILTFHIEATSITSTIIDKIRTKYPHVKIGISIKPQTRIGQIYDLLGRIDLLLIMSVEPGFGGQAFMPAALRKAEQAVKYIKTMGHNTIIEMDGGINESNVKDVIASGVNMVVAGTAVFNSDNIERTIKVLKGE